MNASEVFSWVDEYLENETGDSVLSQDNKYELAEFIANKINAGNQKEKE